jgi:hypothetical protein
MSTEEPLSFGLGRDSLAGQADRAYVKRVPYIFEEGKPPVVLPKRVADGITHSKMPPQSHPERVIVVTAEAERFLEIGYGEIEIRPQIGSLVQPASTLAVRVTGTAGTVRILSFCAAAHTVVIMSTGLVLNFEASEGANCQVREGLLVGAYRVHQMEEPAARPSESDSLTPPADAPGRKKSLFRL